MCWAVVLSINSKGNISIIIQDEIWVCVDIIHNTHLNLFWVDSLTTFDFIDYKVDAI